MVTLIEGFDHISTSAVLAVKGWSMSIGGSAFGVTTGRVSGRAAGFTTGGSGGSSSSFTKNLPAGQTTTIFGFAINFPGTAFGLVTVAAIGGGCSIRFNTGEQIALYNNAGTLVATGATVVSAGWHYIEVKIVAAGASGTGEVHLNGAVEIASTVSNFGTSHTTVQFLKDTTSIGASVPLYFDDVYVADATGGINNDFLGDVAVETIYPTSDGAHTDFTPNAGSTHYTQVDENTPDGDTTYVSSSTIGARDSYGLTDLSVVTGQVFAVQGHNYNRKDDIGLRQVKASLRSGGTDYDGATQTLSTTYSMASTGIHNVDPFDSAAWTIADVNALEAGVKVEA